MPPSLHNYSSYLPQPESAWSQLKSSLPKMQTGCSMIDSLFDGGLKCGLTEVCGEAGVGKTQFILQALVNAQLPYDCGGANGVCIAINTEGELVTNRLTDMISHYKTLHPTTTDHDYLGGIFSIRVSSIEQLLLCIEERLPPYIKSLNSDSETKMTGRPVRLLVLDSISALFRSELSNRSTESKYKAQSSTPSSKQPPGQEARANLSSKTTSKSSYEVRAAMMRIGSKLRALAHEYKLCVLVTNHVTSAGFDASSRGIGAGQGVLEGSSHTAFGPYGSYGTHSSALPSSVIPFQGNTLPHIYPPIFPSPQGPVKPALGLAWSCCIDSRLFMTRQKYPVPVDLSTLLGTQDDNIYSSSRENDEDLDENANMNASYGRYSKAALVVWKREAHLVQCSYAPARSCEFQITQFGVASVPGSLRLLFEAEG